MQAAEKRVRRQWEMNVQTAETKCAGNGKRTVQSTERKRADSNAERECKQREYGDNVHQKQ